MPKQKRKTIQDIPWEMDKTVDRLEIVIPSQMAEELAELVAFYMWDHTEGLRKVLGAGMAALEAQRLQTEDHGSSEETKRRHLTRQLVRSEGRLAAARYRLYEAEEEIKRLALSNAGLRELGTGIEQAIKRQIGEIENLKRELQARDEEIAGLRARLEHAESPLTGNKPSKFHRRARNSS